MSGVPCCNGPAQGSGSNGGGGETLAETLVLGNITDGLPIVVSAGDSIDGVTDLDLTADVDVIITPGTGGTGIIVLSNLAADTAAVRQLETLGANAAASKTFVGDRDPNGVVTGSPGDYYFRGSGVNSALFIHKEAAPSTVWTLIPTGVGLAAIDVSRTTSKSITGTPSGLAFNSEDGGGFDAAVWTWTAGDDDIVVDNDGQYLIHGEQSIDGTDTFEASWVLDWFHNGVAIAGGAHEHGTSPDGFDLNPININSTIIRTLSATDAIGYRVSRDNGSGGSVIPTTARLNIVRLS